MSIDRSDLNIYQLQPREVLMNDDERMMLADESQGSIDQIFETRDHTKRIKTVGAIELDAKIFNPPSVKFAELMPRVYDRAYVEAFTRHVKDVEFETEYEENDEHDADPDNEFLLSAKITLFSEGMPPVFRSEIIISGDMTESEAIDPSKLGYLLRTSIGNTGSKYKVTPLTPAECKVLLDGLVAQANEFRAIIDPNRSFLESIHALLEVASETSVERKGIYRTTSSDQKGFVDVDITDRYLYIDGHERIRSYHGASIESHQPLEGESSSRTMLEIKAGRQTIATTFGQEYLYLGDKGNVELYEQTLKQNVADYNDPERFYPTKLTDQIIKSLKLLIDTPAHYQIESREDF